MYPALNGDRLELRFLLLALLRLIFEHGFVLIVRLSDLGLRLILYGNLLLLRLPSVDRERSRERRVLATVKDISTILS